VIVGFTGYVDRFAQERLPPAELMPELLLGDLEYPPRLNAASFLLDRPVAQGRGQDRCVVRSDGREWSYADLQRHANQIARVLAEDFRLEPGNRVLLRAPNSPLLAACWFGVLKAGGIAVTTMPLYRAGELRFMLEKAHVTHALCDARLRHELERACLEYPGLQICFFNEVSDTADSLERRAASKPVDFDNIETSAQDVAIIAFTSGTTGQPKAAMHYHRDLLAICDTYGARVLQPRASDLFCGSPPLGFTFGLGGLLLFPLFVGAATLLLEKAGPLELMQAVAQFGVTTIFTAPIAYRTMTGMVDDYDISTLRTCVSAGETLPKAVWEEWYAKTGLKILDGIGSTEMLHIFIGSPDAEVRAGSTGRVVPGYIAEIHDDEGKRLPNGEIGRLGVKGPTGCKYLQDQRQSYYVRHGWNYPGDAYRRDDDGYFWYVARLDDMIVSAGYNISGPEVEQALITHADVKEVAVIQ
jgi:2-aminobenzoate-CoA ligase